MQNIYKNFFLGLFLFFSIPLFSMYGYKDKATENLFKGMDGFKTYTDLKLMEQALEDGADIDFEHFFNATPLVYAASKNMFAALRFLIKAGASVDSTTQSGETSLHAAAKSGYVEIVQELIKSGACVNSIDKTGQTPLHFAAAHHRLSVVQELLKLGAEVDAACDSGDTALIMICNWGMYKNEKGRNKKTIVEELLRSGASVNIREKHAGFNALALAVYEVEEEYSTDIVEILLNVPGVEIDCETHFGTPLDMAREKSNQKLIGLLEAALKKQK